MGWQGDPALSKTIFPLIYKFSEGVPRRINLICSRMMLHGCVEQRHQIGVQDIREVIKELQSEHLAAGSNFSDYDFLVEDEYENIPVSNPVMDSPPIDDSVTAQDKLCDEFNSLDSEAPAVPQEVKLHAVGDSAMKSDEQQPAIGVTPAQKKKKT